MTPNIPTTPDSHRRLKYFTRRRRVLVQERAKRVTRLRCDLQALSPGLLGITGAADNQWFLRLLTCWDRLTALPRLHTRTLAGIRGVGPRYLDRIRAWQRTARFAPDIAFADTDVVDDAHAIMALDERIAVLDREIGSLGRFRGEGSLALYLGMAPLDHSSGLRIKGKRPRCVNTRCQTAMMTCVVRHMASVPESRQYYDRKRSEGKTHTQAVRALGRQLVRVIWTMLTNEREYERRSEVSDAAA